MRATFDNPWRIVSEDVGSGTTRPAGFTIPALCKWALRMKDFRITLHVVYDDGIDHREINTDFTAATIVDDGYGYFSLTVVLPKNELSDAAAHKVENAAPNEGGIYRQFAIEDLESPTDASFLLTFQILLLFPCTMVEFDDKLWPAINFSFTAGADFISSVNNSPIQVNAGITLTVFGEPIQLYMYPSPSISPFYSGTISIDFCDDGFFTYDGLVDPNTGQATGDYI